MRSDRPLTSNARILMISFLASFFVLASSLAIQWLVYDDWLHHTGPLRIVGTSMAAVIMFGAMLRWQYSVRERQLEMIRRFEMISHMNDRIRNALQAIECVTYVSQPGTADIVRREVDAIDRLLRGVLSSNGTPSADRNQTSAATFSRKSS